MHVASPGLPESTLRHLFYRAATTAGGQPSSVYSPSARVATAGGGSETAAAPANTTRKRAGGGGSGSGGGGDGGGSRSHRSNSNGDGGGGGGGDGEAGASTPSTSALRLARAIVDFPLACEGLAQLVASTSTELGARKLLKQVVYQAKQALDETEKVRSVHSFGWLSFIADQMCAV